jgi:CheY-like chemotaxis protein
VHIAYVEDRPTDIFAMRRIFRDNQDVTISACDRLDALRAASSALIDLLLIDIMRPDAISLEDDIEAARKITPAPILFLTGMDCETVRERAIRSGAEAVISKASVSAHVIREFAENAAARSRLTSPARMRAAPAPPEGRLDWLSENPGVALFEGPLCYIESALEEVSATLAGGSGASVESTCADAHAAIALMREVGRRDFRMVNDCDASGALSACKRNVIRKAVALGVPFTLDVQSPARIRTIGYERSAQIGLEALITGFLHRAAALGGRLRVKLHSRADEVFLEMSGDFPLIDGAKEFFPTHAGEAGDQDFARVCLQCGAALLGLRREQILVAAASDQRVSIYL